MSVVALVALCGGVTVFAVYTEQFFLVYIYSILQNGTKLLKPPN